MTERDFVYWLQGFLELNREAENPTALTLDASQVKCIQRHLSLVLTNVTSEVPSEKLSSAIEEVAKKVYTRTVLPGTGRIC